MNGCFINGVPVGVNQPLVLDNKSSVAEMRSGLPHFVRVSREFEWVEFRFPGTPVDALHLIKKSHQQIASFVEQIRNELKKSALQNPPTLHECCFSGVNSDVQIPWI